MYIDVAKLTGTGRHFSGEGSHPYFTGQGDSNSIFVATFNPDVNTPIRLKVLHKIYIETYVKPVINGLTLSHITYVFHISLQ